MKVTINLKELPSAARQPLVAAMLDSLPVCMTSEGVSVVVQNFDSVLKAMWNYFAYVSRGLEEPDLASFLMDFQYPLQVESEENGRIISVLVWCVPETGIHYAFNRELRPAR